MMYKGEISLKYVALIIFALCSYISIFKPKQYHEFFYNSFPNMIPKVSGLIIAIYRVGGVIFLFGALFSLWSIIADL